jgi:hypothetical protein
VRWYMRSGCGALAGLVAWLVLWAATPLLGIALDGAFDGCTDRRDCVTDSLGRALLAVAVGITAWWTITFLAGWLALKVLRTDRAAGTAALGMVLTIVLWWRFGELMPVLCVPGFAIAAFAVSRDLPTGTRAGVLGALAIVTLLATS